MEWLGIELNQNETYSNLVARENGYKIIRVRGNISYLTTTPILGKIRLGMSYPKKEPEESVRDIMLLCRKWSVPQLDLQLARGYDWLEAEARRKRYKIELDNRFGTDLIDLLKTEDELWDQMRSKTRRPIRKAEKMGTMVEMTESEDDFDKWMAIYRETADRKEFTQISEDTIRAVFRDSKTGKLLVARAEGKIIAGILLFVDERPMYWLGGAHPDYRQYSPNNLLQWKAMLWAKEQEFPYYDLGGASRGVPSKGVLEFKLGFKGTYFPQYNYTIRFKGFKGSLLNLARGMKKHKNDFYRPSVMMRNLKAIWKRRVHSTYSGGIFFLDISGETENPVKVQGEGEVKIHWGKDNDLSRICRAEMEGSFGRFKKYWDDGNQLMVLDIEGDVAGFLWMAREEIYLNDVEHMLKLQDGEVFVHNVHTFEEFRRRGVFSSLYSYLANDLRSHKSATRVLTFIDDGNQESLAAHERIGMKPDPRHFSRTITFGKKDLSVSNINPLG